MNDISLIYLCWVIIISITHPLLYDIKECQTIHKLYGGCRDYF